MKKRKRKAERGSEGRRRRKVRGDAKEKGGEGEKVIMVGTDTGERAWTVTHAAALQYATYYHYSCSYPLTLIF